MWDLTTTGEQLISGDHAQHVELDAWYDGSVSREGLEVSEFRFTSALDSGAVRGSIDVTIVDVDGSLLSADPTSVLAPYGQQLAVTGVVASLPTADLQEPVPVGTFRIETADPDYRWATHIATRRIYPTGGVVRVTALDCLADLAAAQFTGPTAPRGTVQQAMSALCEGYVGVDVSALPTTSVPASVTYEDSVWDAVKQLAGLADLVPVPTRDGSLTFLAPVIGEPVWDVTIDAMTLITASVSHDRSGLINAVWATGEQDSDGVSPVRALATETAGPFRVSGPLGMQLQRHSSTFYTSTAQALSGATSILQQSIRERSVRVPFVSVWNPALDVLDTVRIQHDPMSEPVLGLVASLSIDVINASMSGECIVPRGSL